MNAAVYRALYERLSVGEGSTTLVVLAQEPQFAGCAGLEASARHADAKAPRQGPI